MAKTTVPGLYIADGAITAAKLSSTLDLSGVTLTVATASSGDNDTTVASTAFVQQEIASLVDSSPSALNTLNELAAAIGDDANFSTTITNSIATKLALAGGTMTGDLIINTTGSIQIPVGTTAQRPTAAQGQLRFNTTTSKPEIYNGSAWADVGGGVESVNSATGVVTLDTDDISEGSTNLYFTNARADARIAAATTDDLSEGSTNLYFTTARANSAIDGRLSGSTGVTVSNGAISIGQDVATSTSPTFQNLTLSGTDSIKVPSGTTAQRSGSPANGMLRYNSSTNEFEGYADSAWGAIGGDTTSSVDLYTATGNGSTATYDTGKNPQSENNTWVFIGGVYQPKSTYSFSGTQITLSENLPNGEDLEVITGTVSTYNPTDAILGQYNVTTSNTASYDTSLTTENENNVFVFIDGVYQPKSSYTYSGSTLTLDATPTSGMSLEVLVTRSMNAATVTTGFLADDAVTTAKILNANVTADKLASSLDLTGKTVTVATASAGDNDTSVASTAFVRQEITALVDSAPAAMDTLNELAAALGDDANFSTTVNASIAAKLPLAGGTLTGDLNFGDDDKAVFGAGSDLQIYHDGSNSWIQDLGTGSLILKADGPYISLQNSTGNDQVLVSVTDVKLSHNGQTKLATTSTGIDVTGTATMDSLVVDGTNGVYTIASNGNDFYYGRNGANYHIANTASGSFNFLTGASSANRLNIASNGDISFYEDTGTTAKFFWDASAESLGIGTGTTSPTNALDINGSQVLLANGALKFADAGNAHIGMIKNSGSSGTGQLEFYTGSAPTERMRIESAGTVKISHADTASEGLRVIQTTADRTSGGALGLFYDDQAGTTQPTLKVIQNGTGDILQLFDGASQVVTVKDGGNVGIGTDSPQSLLHLRATAPIISLTDTNSFTDANDRLIFRAGANEGLIQWYDDSSSSTSTIAVFESGGNVGIGKTNPAAKLDVLSGTALIAQFARDGAATYDFTVTDGGDGAAQLYINAQTANTGYNIRPKNASGTNIDALFINPDGNIGLGTNSPSETLELGDGSSTNRIKIDSPTKAHYIGYDGSDDALQIAAQSFLKFQTGGSFGEAMRISSEGNLLINTTSKTSFPTNKGAAAFGIGGEVNLKLSSYGSAHTYQQFILGGSVVGSISSTTSTTSYNQSSDYRLKENVVEMTGALDRVNQLQPKRFNFIADADTIVDGFLAHEVQDIVPQAVTGEKDAVDSEGNPEYQGIDQSKLVPLLTKAIQEQQTQIETLKQEIQELKE